MIPFRELRRRLEEATIEVDNIYDLLEDLLQPLEDGTFYIYRTDTNAILARNINGFENPKSRTSRFRKSLGLKFDDIKLKSQRSQALGTNGGKSGSTFTTNKGERYPIQYSRNYSPSKRECF
jgi:hypothetical protein